MAGDLVKDLLNSKFNINSKFMRNKLFKMKGTSLGRSRIDVRLAAVVEAIVSDPVVSRFEETVD